MEKIKSKNLFSLEETIGKDLIRKYEYPWECLDEIGEYILNIGPKLDKDRFIQKEENVWVAKSAKISPLAFIAGPVIIDENAEIRPFAYIRGKVIIGKNCVVGNSTEMKNSILFNEVKIPHFNYVGDSILGHKAHMGAGALLSNVRSDGKKIVIKFNGQTIETNRKKIGGMLADNVEIGCNTVVNPGTIIGKNTMIYPASSVKGIIPENCIYKDSENIVERVF